MLNCSICFLIVITLGLNKLVTSIDENKNLEKTETEKENCGNQITSLPTSLGKFICYQRVNTLYCQYGIL